MQQSVHMRKLEPVATRRQHGFTLIELIVATVIMLILVGAAVPIAKNAVARDRERELRQDLWMIRDAIDRYKDAADQQQIRSGPDTQNYPPDLETLVKGVPLGNTGDKTIRFLRKIPIDPITGKADWGKRAVSDDYDSTSWGGKNVFDVYSSSQATAINGSRYADW